MLIMAGFLHGNGLSILCPKYSISLRIDAMPFSARELKFASIVALLFLMPDFGLFRWRDVRCHEREVAGPSGKGAAHVL